MDPVILDTKQEIGPAVLFSTNGTDQRWVLTVAEWEALGSPQAITVAVHAQQQISG